MILAASLLGNQFRTLEIRKYLTNLHAIHHTSEILEHLDAVVKRKWGRQIKKNKKSRQNVSNFEQ